MGTTKVKNRTNEKGNTRCCRYDGRRCFGATGQREGCRISVSNSNCYDVVTTNEAFENLKELVGKEAFVPASLLACSEESILKAVEPVSFYKVKAKNILLASKRCVEEFNNDIPTDIDAMLSFKGVGPKIAYLTFTIAHGETLGICVDTHVHRISNRLGWVDTWAAKSNGPERTRKALEAFLPREKWGKSMVYLWGLDRQCALLEHPNAVSAL